MICNNCGNEMPEGSSYCSKCGKKIEAEVESKEIVENTTEEVIYAENAEKTDKTINQKDNNVSEDDNEKANFLTIISLFLVLIVPILIKLFSSLFEMTRNSSPVNLICGISMLVGFTILIDTRNNYPKHYASKILLEIIIALAVVCFSIVLWFVVSCVSCILNPSIGSGID